MSRPELSLCVVARNEAALVGDAIASARPVVDDVVVVDTGSTDDTPHIASRAGARVVHAPWPGDLARAHDLPVAHARGDWVLVLDADEMLDPARREGLRELIRTGGRDGYAVPVRNYTYGWWDNRWRPADSRDPLTRGAAGYVPTEPIRLFRRDPAHRFTGALHQTVVPAIRANGGRIGHADVPIHHYGFLRFDRDKSSLYRRLARQQTAARPDDAQAWVDLGILLMEDERRPDAADAFRRARRLGDSGDAAFLLGSALLAMDHAAAAIPHLRDALGASEAVTHHFDPADAWDALGHAWEQLDELGDAQAAYRTAAQAGKPGATANLIGLLLDTGHAEEAGVLLDEALVRYPGIDVLWSLRGVCRLRTGAPTAAGEALETALDIRPENAAARVNLAVAYKRAGRPRAAARAFTGAREALAGEEGRRLDLARRLPQANRPPQVTDLPEGPGLVVSVIPALAGGGGRVLVDAVRALAPRPQLVACATTYAHSGQGLTNELAAMGVDVVTFSGDGELQRLLRRVRPSVVLHHWWRGSLIPGPLRVTDARWVCIGHAPLPMPLGYDAWVANSRYHRSIQPHLPADRVVDLPNGVDLDRFQPAAGTPAEPVTVVMVSRMDPGKFPRALLSYLPPLHGARVLIAGFGARRHELEPDIAARGLADQVRFLGPVRSADVPQLLASADIGLHLTEMHRELCSMSMLEMLASALPVVAEPKGGLPEMVTHGMNGLLADEPEMVARHLRQLIDDRDLRARMGAASREVAHRYDMTTYRESVRGLVTDVERRDRPQQGFRAARDHDKPAASAATHPPSLSYLICSTPRSGSNLLCEALANTGLAGHPQEFFSPSVQATLVGRWGADTIAAYLAELCDRTTTPNAVFGAKLMAGHLPQLLSDLRALPGLADLEAPAVLAAALPGLRYVWIHRSDRLRQAISLLRAQQTDTWIRPGTADRHHVAPRFDRAKIRDRMAHLDAVEAGWRDFFADAGIDPIHVHYEELVADYEGTARRVVAELGITAPTDLRFGERRLEAQADELTEQWVQRFRREAQPASG